METVLDRVLSPAELRALSGRTNAEGARRVAIHAALLIGTGWLVAIIRPGTLVPAMLAFGLVQVALFAPAHEATHQTAFASRRANLIVGWLAACPSLLNLHFYTAFHFAHHRHTQIAGSGSGTRHGGARRSGRAMCGAYWACRTGGCGCW